MHARSSRSTLVFAATTAVACLLQIVGLIRHVSRLPEDWIGIGLYATTIAALAAGALGFYARWRKDKQEQR